jgi:hypothetical protein
LLNCSSAIRHGAVVTFLSKLVPMIGLAGNRTFRILVASYVRGTNRLGAMQGSGRREGFSWLGWR